MDKLAEVRRRIETLRECLPLSVDVRALGVLEKAPNNLLSVREALAWRTEELARNACEMLEKGNVATGIILTRAVVESAVFVWRLKEILQDRSKYKNNELAEMVLKMSIGRKNEPNFPEAINILTIIKHAEKNVPGIEKRYNYLSEFVHPNWSGVGGLFSNIDYENHITYFGRDFEKKEAPKNGAAIMLVAALDMFEHAYNKISEEIQVYIKELTPIYSTKE